MASFFQKISDGLGNTRQKFQEQVNVLLSKGPNLDEDFWEGLEDALISADIGAPATIEIIDNLRDEAARKALPDANAVIDLLHERIAEQFAKDKKGILKGDKAVLLFVGINGTGKTTTVGKIAKEATDLGLNVILGSADTFRAAAIEQLEVWANRANVEMVSRERGSDPASVCYETIERAEQLDSDLVLIDTAGRLHTSKDLMSELEKVCAVTRKRANIDVYVVLVIDATTGQNGLTQAKEFNKSLDLDALIITKLDGTAKGGIALAISKELDLPILKIGVGEKIDDLRNFNPYDFAKAFIGNYGLDEQSNISQQDNLISENDEAQELENDDVVREEPEHQDYIQEVVGQQDSVQEETLERDALQQDYSDEIIEHEDASQDNVVQEESFEKDDFDDVLSTDTQYEDSQQQETSSSDTHDDGDNKKKKGKFRGLFDKLFID